MARGTDRRRDALLAPGERWGWEYRLVAPAVPDEGREDGPAVPEPEWALPAADRYAAAVRSTHRYRWPAVGAAGLAAVCLALAPLLPVVGIVAAVCAVLALTAAALAVVPRMAAVRAADAAYADWVDGCPPAPGPAPVPPEPAPVGRWCAVGPVAAERVDVYGGTDTGRAELLSTLAGSVIGSGGSVTVLDLTGESAARDLVRLAGAAGHRLDLLSLPDHLPAVGLLSGLAAGQVGTVLAEAVHAVDRDPDTGDRSADATLVGQAVAALRGTLTFRRVAAALLALAGTDRPDPRLTAAEHAHLAAVRGQAATAAAGPRLRRLAAAASQLALLEEHDPGVRPYRDPHAQLRVMQLLGCDPELSTGLLAQVLLGTLLHQVRRQKPGDGPPRLLVVVGADGLRRAQLERLDALTRRRGIRLVVMYRRLRADAVAPTGTDATLVLRQDTEPAAAHAAALIGGAALLRADGVRTDATPAHLTDLPETAYVLLDPHDPGTPRLLYSRPGTT